MNSLGRRSKKRSNSSSWALASCLPASRLDRHQLVEGVGGVVQPVPVEVVVARHPADGALDRVAAAAHALDDPLEHAHVLAEARPQELAVLVLAEPVDAEDARRVGHRRPMLSQWPK
jgi:hypothetical protein